MLPLYLVLRTRVGHLATPGLWDGVTAHVHRITLARVFGAIDRLLRGHHF